MKTCKNCTCVLDEHVIDVKDKRYCKNCATAIREHFNNQRLVLSKLRLLPLKEKIELTKKYIIDAISEFGPDSVYISYSGGKDSTVLSHIAKQLYPNILHIFADTTCEFPETIQHVEWERAVNKTNIITVYPYNKNGELWSFKKVVEYYGYPVFSKRVANAIRTYRHARTPRTIQNSIDYIQRNFAKYEKYKELNISDKCCEVLKKNPIKRQAKKFGMKCVILGLLADESRQREKDLLQYGCNVFHIKSENQCRPLAFWTEADIQTYIEQYDVKISKLYDMGYSRNGCMYCAFGAHLEKEGHQRFIQLKKTHPNEYTYFIQHFGTFMLELNIAI